MLPYTAMNILGARARVAEDDGVLGPANTTKMKTKRRRCTPTAPQPGSLYDILHDNAGVSLFVRPLSWTDLHTKLLGCRFVQLPAFDAPTPPSSLPLPSSSPSSTPPLPPAWSSFNPAPKKSINIPKIIDWLMSPNKHEESKNRAMAAMLADFYPQAFTYPQDHFDLDLRFGNRRYDRLVRVQLLFNHIYPSLMSFDSSTTICSASHSQTVSISNEPSVLAYVSRSRLSHIRNSCYNVHPGPPGIFNGPVRRLQALRSKSLMPKNLDEDPYFISVMLALAQQSVYPNLRTNHGFVARDVKVHLLTVAEEEAAFIVYTATVPAALLSMFHEPDVAPTGNSSLQVEYARIPAWPIEDLKERLGKALGSDIVGDLSDAPMYTHEDTYEDEAEAFPPSITKSFYYPSAPKRKRGVFSEVMNTSFYEDHESDAPRKVKAKKRRRIEKKTRELGIVRTLFSTKGPS
ncbi:hypothetical protein F5B22DRAFT_630269 [Xylaria bambusicola]|uniref:uncharacterized protein n=1 Tax=Xylaria bambusicola TaxID=326684 RepID=UPI0020084466|nr:uncharacterized protein F5B22DRAFT_630269 [Xylaria bambusicola]KAI0503185.1 hypothetical protein F5B22DRAFT_630269 [Xylaria bambusicola]